MKNPTALRHVNQVGTLDTSQAVAMGMDADGMVILMGMLSNMYSDGNLAVVREYSCNALDSHVQAKQTRPVEISLPTPLNPQFKVQDYGVGLSYDEIMKTYAQYGASTKRDSNEQIGAFGIGAKSAFTVGNAFTVTGVKDGEKTIALFELNSIGAPTVNILYRGATDEPNGVLVDVGVENVNAIRLASTKLFKCWKPGTVLVDGDPVPSIYENTIDMGDDIHLQTQDVAWNEHFKIIMGGVPYPIPQPLWNEINSRSRAFADSISGSKVGFIIEVPIGSVDITPSREELRVTTKTKQTFSDKLADAEVKLSRWISDQLKSAKTKWEAAQTTQDLRVQLGMALAPSNLTWKGQDIGPEHVVVPDATTFTIHRIWNDETEPHRMHRIKRGEDTVLHIDLRNQNWKNILFVTDVPEDKVNTVRLYAKHTLLAERAKGNNMYHHVVALPKSLTEVYWFSVGKGAESGLPYVTFKDYWEEGKKLRKAAPKGRGSKTAYYTFIAGNVNWKKLTAADVADLDMKTVYWVNFSSRDRTVDALEKDAIIVGLSGQQSFEVLERNLPGIKSWRDEVKRQAKAKIAKFTKQDLDLFRIEVEAGDTTGLGAVKFIEEQRSKITNRDVIKFADAFRKRVNQKLSNTDLGRLAQMRRLYNQAGEQAPEYTHTADTWLMDNLPLLAPALDYSYGFTHSLNDQFHPALVDYINNAKVNPV